MRVAHIVSIGSESLCSLTPYCEDGLVSCSEVTLCACIIDFAALFFAPFLKGQESFFFKTPAMCKGCQHFWPTL